MVAKEALYRIFRGEKTEEGMAKLEKLAQWPQREHHDATDGRREGIEECFTINRLDVQPSLHRCLANHEFDRESSFGSSSWDPARCGWMDKPMAKRWSAADMLATEKNVRRVMGHTDLWALQAILDGKHEKQA